MYCQILTKTFLTFVSGTLLPERTDLSKIDKVKYRLNRMNSSPDRATRSARHTSPPTTAQHRSTYTDPRRRRVPSPKQNTAASQKYPDLSNIDNEPRSRDALRRPSPNAPPRLHGTATLLKIAQVRSRLQISARSD